MNGFQLSAVKHAGGDFSLRVLSLQTYNGQHAMGRSLAEVLDAAVLELGLSVHEVHDIQVSAVKGESIEPEDLQFGSFFENRVRLVSESRNGLKTFENGRYFKAGRAA